MKRTILVAVMAAMLVVAATGPSHAVVGVERPEDPDMMVITSMPEEPVEAVKEPVDEQGNPLERVVGLPTGDKRWYTIPEAMTPPQQQQQYSVVKGDSLWKIVSKLVKTNNPAKIAKGVEEVVKTNNLTNPDLIHTGDVLRVPTNLVK